MSDTCEAAWKADTTKGRAMARFRNEPCRHTTSERGVYGGAGCGVHFHCMDCGGYWPEEDDPVSDEDIDDLPGSCLWVEKAKAEAYRRRSQMPEGAKGMLEDQILAVRREMLVEWERRAAKKRR